jgi:NDP-sugar pyrophosphorylase family protein
MVKSLNQEKPDEQFLFGYQIEENSESMQAVILAAGAGRRLHPLTLDRSKGMLPILGKPIVERVVEHFVSIGINDFILVVHPHDRSITRYFQHESHTNADIRFVYQENPIGTADALKKAVPLIEGDFYLSACDNLITPDYLAKMKMIWNSDHEINTLLTLMEVEENQLTQSAAVELKEDQILRIIEKPSPGETRSKIVSLPLYCFSQEFLTLLPEIEPSPRTEYEIQSGIQLLIDRYGGVRGVDIDSRITITTPEDLLNINQQYLTAGFEQPQIQPQAVGKSSHLTSPLYIEKGTIIGANCIIGPNVYLEKNCIIGDNVEITDSVILREVEISPNTKINNQIVSKSR